MNTFRLSTLVLLLLGASVQHQANGLSVKPLARRSRNTNINHRNLQPGEVANPLQATVAASYPDQPRENPVSALYSKYLNWIDRSPLIAKSVTAAVIGCLGDVMAQWLEARNAGVTFTVNLVRFNAFFASGLLFVGPFLHLWYEQLWSIGRYLENNVTKKKHLQTLMQVFVDQTVGAMLFFPSYFYAYEMCEALVSLRAPKFAVATQKLTANLGGVFWMQYRIWPLVNFLSFSFVPERMRGLTNNIVSVFWNAFLCTQLA